MLRQFESNILKKGLFSKKENIVLAISGGVDSVVLAHLLKGAGFNFSLAHCNFKLRGKESDGDEKLCEQLAKKLKVNIYRKSFDVKAYCREQKTNVQLAARKLRYDWFHQLVKEQKIAYVLTAHHANDVVETIFINLLRGTGINGLKGIPEKNGHIVRPLLNFTREEIEAYAKKEKIVFRLDKTNLEDKYERNFIRLNVIPLLKKINPKLEETFIRNTTNFREEAEIIKDYMEDRSTDLITQTPGLVFINKKKLKHEKYAQSVLHHLVSGYGFNVTQQKNILRNLEKNALPGKVFRSATHQLCLERNDLVIKPLAQDKEAAIRINSLSELGKQELLNLDELQDFILPQKNELVISKDQLIFPLTLRKRLTGDKFKPFGMKGFKLISDFLREEKLGSLEKEKCRLLVNGNGDILWVAGYRSDERYRVESTAANLLKLTLVG